MPTFRPLLAPQACLASLSLFLLFGLPANAQNADGQMGFFERLFSPPSPVQQIAPAVQSRDIDGGYARRSIRRAANRRHPRIRYAALQNSEPLQLRVTDRQKPLDMKGGAAAAFMKDETLRPGDIVVLKEGMKVFVGRTDSHHAARDFESVWRSDFVDRHTRVKLAAMMMPVGAMPADEARKAMARVRKLTPVSVEPVQAEASAMRVINPWTMGQ